MMATLHAHLLGAAIGLAVTGSLLGVMRWMLRLPRRVSAEAARERGRLGEERLILVPIAGSADSPQGMELACEIAAERRAGILLLYVIEVPLTVPLGATLEQAEGEAGAALEAAREFIARHRVPVSTLIWRDRQLGTGTLAVARDYRADLIVMGVGPRQEREHPGWGRIADRLLHRAPCEVIVDRLGTSRGHSIGRPSSILT